MNTRQTWNPDNTLAQVLNQVLPQGGNPIPISQHDYTYDGVGNRQIHTQQIGGSTTPYTYTYDLQNRLLTVTGTTTERYAYDLLGNRLRKDDGTTYTHFAYDAAHQLLGTCVNASPTPCTPSGQFTTTSTATWSGEPTAPPPPRWGTIPRTASSGGYDPENRLVWVGGPAQVPQTYAYDAQGRRVIRDVGSEGT